MILTLFGLILNFLGSAGLVYDTLTNLGKPRSVYLPANEELGYKEIKFEHQPDKFLKRVKYTKEEMKLIAYLFLLCFGFFLQILDFVKV